MTMLNRKHALPQAAAAAVKESVSTIANGTTDFRQGAISGPNQSSSSSIEILTNTSSKQSDGITTSPSNLSFRGSIYFSWKKNGDNASVPSHGSSQNHDNWSDKTGSHESTPDMRKQENKIQLQRWVCETSHTRMTVAEILEKSKWDNPSPGRERSSKQQAE